MDKYLDQLKDLTIKVFKDQPFKVVLFGSRAVGNNSPTSDADIGIIPYNEHYQKTITLFREKVEDLNIPYKVDVINFAESSDEFCQQALKGAIVWKD